MSRDDDPPSQRPDEEPPSLPYADPYTPPPCAHSEEVESWADVGRAMGIVAFVLVFLFLVIAMVCGGLV